MKCSIPAERASSTTCWMTGRSTTVSISFGIALVAGRKRVPRPATGNTALRIRFWGAGMGNSEPDWLGLSGGPATGADLEYDLRYGLHSEGQSRGKAGREYDRFN